MTRSTMRRAVLAAAGVAVLVSAVVSVPTGANAATVKYYTAQPVCGKARPGHMTCFAMRRVLHTRKVAGARPATALPHSVGIGPAGGYTSGDIANAYGFARSGATTQTVGIVDAYNDPNALTDLNVFDAHYDLPAETATSFKKVSQTGSTTSLPAANTDWAGEISLDLDAVRGLCNKCKIVLVEATSTSDADLGSAVDEAVNLHATIVSNSYGGAESQGAPSASVLADYNHPGVVITASSGDDGYFDWDYYNYPSSTSGRPSSSSASPEFPASDNTVVAVGGTTLQLNDDGTRSGESVWNENGTADNAGYYAQAAQGATGGGCSTLFTAKSFQSGVANYAQTACGTKRLVADISALADPFTGYDIYDTYVASGAPSGWQTFGGTSLASPIIAAMWGLAGGSGGVAYPAASLYSHFKSTPSSLYDVTTGGDGYCGGGSVSSCQSVSGVPNTLGYGPMDCAWHPTSAYRSVGTRACDAATGYDGASGVGTPRGLTAFKAG